MCFFSPKISVVSTVDYIILQGILDIQDDFQKPHTNFDFPSNKMIFINSKKIQ